MLEPQLDRLPQENWKKASNDISDGIPNIVIVDVDERAKARSQGFAKLLQLVADAYLKECKIRCEAEDALQLRKGATAKVTRLVGDQPAVLQKEDTIDHVDDSRSLPRSTPTPLDNSPMQVAMAHQDILSRDNSSPKISGNSSPKVKISARSALHKGNPSGQAYRYATASMEPTYESRVSEVSDTSTLRRRSVGGRPTTTIAAEHYHERALSNLDDFQLLKGWKTVTLGSLESNLLCKRASAQALFAHLRCLTGCIHNQKFEIVVTLVIFVNAVLMGIEADTVAQGKEVPLWVKVSDNSIMGFFVTELLLKFLATGTNFFRGADKWWHIIDLCVVLADVFATFTLVFANEDTNLTQVRMIRVIRLTRAIRVVRLVRFFKEFRMLVYALIRSGTSLMWSLVFFFFIIYVFAIFLMQQVSDYVANEHSFEYARRGEMKKMWGGLFPSCYTMYCCIAGGISWREVSDDLIETGWVAPACLLFFIFFTIFVVTNIITGIFVDTAIQGAQNDRDEIIQEQLHNRESELAQIKEVFKAADADDSGTITAEELIHHLQDRFVLAHLHTIGLEVHEAVGLFRLLDVDETHHVSIDEFVVGCMRLKGGARSIDVATLMYETKRMMDRFVRFEESTAEMFQVLFRGLDIAPPEFDTGNEKASMKTSMVGSVKILPATVTYPYSSKGYASQQSFAT